MGSKHPAQGSGSDSTHSGEALFLFCQRLAQRDYPPSQGHGILPSGARIFYFTRLLLLREGWLPAIEPDERPLEAPLAARFQELAPHVARQLAADFKHAPRFLEHPNEQARRFLSDQSLRSLPDLLWAPEHLVGIRQRLRQKWQAHWSAAWRQAGPEHLARILPLLNEQRLPVTAVAPASAKMDKALELLRERLAEERMRQAGTQHSGLPSLPERYLYDEPLDDWLLRPLLSGRWLFRLCQALADLAQEVPVLVRQRAASLGAGGDAAVGEEDEDEESEAGSASIAGWQQEFAMLPEGMRRRIPAPPQGQVTATAIFYYTTTAWRMAHGPAADPLLPDARLLPPAQFRELLALAVQVTEHLLWDETVPLRARPAESAAGRAEPTITSAQRQHLRQALVLPRLRRYIQRLRHREQQRRHQTAARPFSPWMAWEGVIQTIIDDAARRLAISIAPAAITGERLQALLLKPLVPESRPYLYTLSLGDWLYAALPERLPTGNDVLSFSRVLAQEVGMWPPNTPGAPADAEQAALGIFWYCKLALEARIGGLAIWLDGLSLPPEALELATVAAPLIARVLHHSSWAACQRGQPLLLARLKAGDQASWAQLEARLYQRAQEMGHDQRDQAVGAALEKLHEQVERLVLPADVTPALLAGESILLEALEYTHQHIYTPPANGYQFLGDFGSFARSFIRRASPEDICSLDDLKEEPAERQAETSPSNLEIDEETLRTLLTLILEAGQAGAPSIPGSPLTAQDALVLAHGLLATANGRHCIAGLLQEQASEAQGIIRLWREAIPSKRGHSEPLSPRPAAPSPAEQIAEYAALTRLLACAPVRRSAALRQAIGFLFELPMDYAEKRPITRPPLGMLERVMTWTQQPEQRAEALLALEALGHLPKTQRWVLCARLLTTPQMRLTLALLEQSGWPRPPWLQEAALERLVRKAALADATAALEGDEPPAVEGERSAPGRIGRGSPQLFQVARKGWLARLADTTRADAWRACSLTGEWLGLHFWSTLWLQRPQEGQAALFYATLLRALPTRLFQVIGAAYALARSARLASLAEVVGLIGCMPPQLPAQLDTSLFLQALHRKVLNLSSTYSDDEAEADEAALRRLRQEFQAARRRILSCFLAIAGVSSDQQRKLLLAALSLADGEPDRLNRWIEGQALSADDRQTLYREMKRWQSRIAAQEIAVPDLLLATSVQVRTAWRQLRRSPSL